MTCCSPMQTGLLAELADIDVLMNGRCFGERAVEELELQNATKVLCTLKMIQKTNCCLLGTSHLHQSIGWLSGFCFKRMGRCCASLPLGATNFEKDYSTTYEMVCFSLGYGRVAAVKRAVCTHLHKELPTLIYVYI